VSFKSESNRAGLWRSGTGDSHHECAANKSVATVGFNHFKMDQNLWGMSQVPWWIYATKNWRKKVQHISNKVCNEGIVCIISDQCCWASRQCLHHHLTDNFSSSDFKTAAEGETGNLTSFFFDCHNLSMCIYFYLLFEKSWKHNSGFFFFCW